MAGWLEARDGVNPSTMAQRTAYRRSPSLADSVLDSAADLASDLASAGKAFLVSEQGRRFRRGLAAAVIIGAPVISELPVFRRTIVGRLLRTAAVGTLVIKGAEWLRDWEPMVSVIEQPGVADRT